MGGILSFESFHMILLIIQIEFQLLCALELVKKFVWWVVGGAYRDRPIWVQPIPIPIPIYVHGHR